MMFCFNDTATTECYTYWHTLSLHDALPISVRCDGRHRAAVQHGADRRGALGPSGDVDASRHRRNRADHRHGGRRERADLRTDTRGTEARPNADLGGGCRLTECADGDHRREPDDLNRPPPALHNRTSDVEGRG